MEIEGRVTNIIYRNEDNGFTVMQIVDSSENDICAVGILPLASVGERVALIGDWAEHPTYGVQFKAAECRTIAPATLTAIVSYLGSGLIRGVGPATAQSIVESFGMDTLRVMEERPLRLAEVPGIGKIRAKTIAESYNLQRGMRDIMLALQTYGVTVGQALKLYRIYGELCLAKIQENPYRLIDDVDTIGFKTADRIARNAGIEHDSDFRLRAGVKYTMQAAIREGHTCLPKDKLAEVAVYLLGTDIAPVERMIDELIIDGSLVQKIVGRVETIFLPYMFRMESECARRLNIISRPPAETGIWGIAERIERLEGELKVELAPLQKQAVEAALTNGAMVITGGPGTGKTTILQFIIRIIEELGLDYELCAPTGRAAKRMSEATGYEARTIHRMLEYNIEGFMKNEEDTLECDVIIVDEMSMVDVPLMCALLKATGMGTRLIMVGDADQLPPVGPGSVLNDIIKSGVMPVIRLTEIFRQADRSMIVENAHRINAGREIELDDDSGDFLFEQIPSAEETVKRAVSLCLGRSKKLGTDDPIKDVQVLVPMKKGALGVKNLNERLQAALNPKVPGKLEKKYGDTVFREGDKVMQTKNNYRIEWKRQRNGRFSEKGQGVFNGDLGTIMGIDTLDQTVSVLFDDERAAEYDFSQLEELELAYCISIHKSQGSEFPIVLLPITGGPPVLMTRNLLYTAVTRARKQVYIIGSRSAVCSMVDNVQTKRRYTALDDLLLTVLPVK